MAVYNTSYYSANTAVRAFLTKVGEQYLRKTFNTNSGTSQKIWYKIRDEIFESRCAYCRSMDSKLHMSEGEFRYPELNESEQHAIRVIANSLHENIKMESEKALKMYEELDRAFVKH